MKTPMTKDITRAIARPTNRSRTRAINTMRGPATPMPCMKRPNSSISKEVESMEMTLPTMKIASPMKMVFLRPNWSDRGP